MPAFMYEGPLTRVTRPKKNKNEQPQVLVLVSGNEYDLKAGEFPGLMDRHRDPKLGKLTLVEKPKAAATSSKAKAEVTKPKGDAKTAEPVKSGGAK